MLITFTCALHIAHVYLIILMRFMNMYKQCMLLRYKVVINGLKKKNPEPLENVSVVSVFTIHTRKLRSGAVTSSETLSYGTTEQKHLWSPGLFAVLLGPLSMPQPASHPAGEVGQDILGLNIYLSRNSDARSTRGSV